MFAPPATDLPADITELRRLRASAASKVARIRERTLPGDPVRIALEADLAEALIVEHVAKQIAKFGPISADAVDRIATFVRLRATA